MLLFRNILFRCNRNKFCRRVIDFYAYILGWYFDNFVKQYNFEGLKLSIPKDLTDRKFRARFVVNSYEWREIYLLNKHLSKDAKILELGGAFGLVSCISNQKLNVKDNHIVIEANPDVIKTLKENRDINGCKFEVIEGLISKYGDKDFYLKDNIIGSSAYRKTGRKVRVKSFTFDEIEHEKQISFDTIIMDIEGGEYDFIIENEKKLKQLKMILIEFHPKFIGYEKCGEIRNILSKNGLSQKEILHDVEVWVKN